MPDHEDAINDDDLGRVETLLRDIGAEDLELHDPPAAVWEGIAVGVAEDQATAEPESARSRDAEVVSLASRRRFSPRLLGSSPPRPRPLSSWPASWL